MGCGSASPQFHRVLRVVISTLLVIAPFVPAAAAEYVLDFESSKTSWRVQHDQRTRVNVHRRQTDFKYSGNTAEQFSLSGLVATDTGTNVRLIQDIPGTRFLDDTRLSVWFKADRDAAVFMVRCVLPRQIDPVTGRPLVLMLKGESYSDVNQWQEIGIRDMDTAFQRELRAARFRLSKGKDVPVDIDVIDRYIDRIELHWATGPGDTTAYVDRLWIDDFIPLDSAAESSVQQASAEFSQDDAITINVDHLRGGALPIVPRIIPHHGESIDILNGLWINTVWVPEYDDENAAALHAAGFRIMATPPRVTERVGGSARTSQSASLLPFGPSAAKVSIWNLGTRLTPDMRKDVELWAEQVRAADRDARRLITADVSGSERAYSRQMPFLAMSRPALQNSLGLAPYRNWLVERRQQAHPGSFLWTWIQTEPAARQREERAAAGWLPSVLEPEQILLNTYSAISAGYRGLGFWTNSSLAGDSPGTEERRLMLAAINMQLAVIEPWLAMAKVQHVRSFSVTQPRGPNANQLAFGFGNSSASQARQADLLRETDNQRRRNVQPDELQATVLRCEGFGQLIVMQWNGEGAQYVPGELAANNATVLVEGAPETAQAYEVSATSVNNIRRTRRVPGGLEITLEKIDMVAVIVVTSDFGRIRQLNERMERVKRAAAVTTSALAKAKLLRVMETDRLLHGLGLGQADSKKLLQTATEGVRRSEEALAAGDWHAARLRAGESMQLMRVLQQSYWFDAVRSLSSPVASPHTSCFHTLPDHWRMLGQFGNSRSSTRVNQLESGDFEDFSAMVDAGWVPVETEVPGLRSAAEFYPDGRQNGNCLRLVSAPISPDDPPTVIRERPVTVISPAVDVRAGQIVYIGGWVKVAAPTLASWDGALVFDSIGGLPMAHRFRKVSGWQHFELLRESREDVSLTVTLTLAGLGDVRFDDLSIVVFDPQQPVSKTADASAADANPGSPAPRWYDFRRHLPDLTPTIAPAANAGRSILNIIPQPRRKTLETPPDFDEGESPDGSPGNGSSGGEPSVSGDRSVRGDGSVSEDGSHATGSNVPGANRGTAINAQPSTNSGAGRNQSSDGKNAEASTASSIPQSTYPTAIARRTVRPR